GVRRSPASVHARTAGGRGCRSVVIAAGCDAHLIVDEPVNESEFGVDPSRPVAREPVFEWLGLADPFVAVPDDVQDQLVDPLEQFAILSLPPQTVVPGLGAEDDLHSTRSRAEPPPDSSVSIEVRSRRAFAGLRRRYAVSLSDS